jgi:uncharacterized protein DUF1176
MKFSAAALLAFWLSVLVASAACAQNEPAVPQKLIARALEVPECSVSPKEAADSVELADLGRRLKLVTISCWRAAYNFGSVLFALDPAAPDNARLLSFQIYSEKKFVQTYQLSNVDYNEKTRTLSSLHKGRGVGDCGSIGEWKWTGTNFKLTGYWLKENCDGEPFDNDGKKWRVFPRR